MKKFNRWFGSLFIFTIFTSSVIFAGFENEKSDNAGPFDPIHSPPGIPADITKYINCYLDDLSLAQFGKTCATIHNLTQDQLIQKKAQHEIAALIGRLVELKPGAYVDPYSHQVEVTGKLLIPETDVTQAQYDLVMGTKDVPHPSRAKMNPNGNEPNLVGPKKPMGGLTYAEWDTYILELNIKLAALSPVAYPGQPILKARRPEAKELRYAMTEPTDGSEEATLNDGTKVKITGKLTEHSGTDSQNDDEVKKYVVFDKNWNDGPSDVDSVKLNQRRLKELNGNIWKQTSTSYFGIGSYRVVLGGCWYDDRQYCRSAYRSCVDPGDSHRYVGARLVFDLEQ